MVFIVLGMHKSGTTLLSEILHKSKISMVDEEQNNLSYEEGDKFERRTTNDINKELLDAYHSLDSSDKDISYTEDQINNIRHIIDKYEDNNAAWGFKDPRTCLTYHIWKQILPKHKILIVYRSPYQVMAHYYNSTRRFDKLIIRSYRGLQTWKKYNQMLLKLIENSQTPTFVINYQDLMSKESLLQNISDFVGHPLYDARDIKRFKRKKEQSFLYNLFEFFSGYQASKIYAKLEKNKSYQ